MTRIKRRIRALLNALGVREWRLWDWMGSTLVRHVVFDDPIDTLVYALSCSRADLFFVQIGSHDTTHKDPLQPFLSRSHWRGIMVEPVSYVFNRLVARHGGTSRFILENVAIAEEGGERDFFHLAEANDADIPFWYDQLGSFSRELVLKHRHAIPDIEQRLITTRVKCLTFAELCARHPIDSLDLIHIDTEGFDYQILKQIDFERHKPILVLYEHKHLADLDRSAARELLDANGYRSLEVGPDTIAVRVDALHGEPLVREAWDAARR
jgi:FkbM family methyltransferase